jgi:DNA-binding beta-propeller fold protein YncE
LTFNYTVGASDISDRLEYASTTALALNGGTIVATSDGVYANLVLPSPYTVGYLGADKLFKINPTLLISDGKTASDLIGQYSSNTVLTPQYTNSNAGLSSVGVTGPEDTALDLANHRMFVVDSTNNRVLVFNLDTNNHLENKVVDNVLGQLDFTTATSGTTSSTLNLPKGIVYESSGNKLYIADTGNNRVLVFDVATISDGEPAVNVLGQADFVTATTGLTSSTLNAPNKLVYQSTGTKLYVSDTNNNRVVVFDVGSISDGEPAVNVLGQANFTSGGSATSMSGLSAPRGLAYNSIGNVLYVADTNNNRVIMYDVASIADGENAVNVLGQTDFVSSPAVTSQNGFSSPRGLVYESVSERLFVADNGNHRVLVFDVASLTNGQNASNVIGQTNYFGNTSSTTQAGLNGPVSMSYDPVNTRLYVTQNTANRITVYDVQTFPKVVSLTSTATNGVKNTGAVIPIKVNFNTPVTVTGTPQLTLETGATDTVVDYASGSGTTSLTFNYTVAVGDLADRLDVVSTTALSLNGGTIQDASLQDANLTLSFTTSLVANHLFKINPTLSLSNGKAPFDLMFQYTTPEGFLPNYTGFSNNTSPIGVRIASLGTAIDYVNHRMFVTDTGNHRVLVFNLDANNNVVDKTPDAVLGQPNLTVASNTNVSQSGLFFPGDVAYDSANNYLFVSDSSHKRVLVFDVTTITNGENAQFVLGQPDFTTELSAISQSSLGSAGGLLFKNNKLYVSDSAYARVMIFDTTSLSNGEAAVNVLGQTDYVTSTTGVTQNKFTAPGFMAYQNSNDYLYVGDSHRVLVFDVASITNGENAVNVLGQSNFTTNVAGIGQSGFGAVQGIAIDNTTNRAFIGDQTNNRVLVFDVNSIANGENAVNVVAKYGYLGTTGAVTKTNIGFVSDIFYDETNARLYVGGGIFNNRMLIYDAAKAPNIASISSATANGNKVTGNVIAIDVTFNEAVTVAGGTPTLTLETGATDAVATYASGSGTTTLTFHYTVGASDSNGRLDVVSETPFALNGATIKNGSNVDANLEVSYAVSLSANNLFKINPSLGLLNNKNAFDVIGQYSTTDGFLNSYTTSSIHNGNSLYELGFNLSFSFNISPVIDTVDHRLFVSDVTNSRVLVFNLDTNNNLIDRIPDNVLGKTSFTVSGGSLTQSSLSNPKGLAYDSTNKLLYVADQGNNRVMIFDVTTITNGENAVNVLGQPNFVTSSAGSTQAGMNLPNDVALDTVNNRLFVVQSSNHRVTVYDVNSITNGENATFVLGQSSFTTNS